jgi:hypothetical protein
VNADTLGTFAGVWGAGLSRSAYVVSGGALIGEVADKTAIIIDDLAIQADPYWD